MRLTLLSFAVIFIKIALILALIRYMDSDVKTCFHRLNICHVISMYITTFGRSLVILMALLKMQPQTAWMPAELQTATEG